MKKCIVVINPNSGHGINDKLINKIKEILKEHRYNSEVILTEYAHHAEERFLRLHRRHRGYLHFPGRHEAPHQLRFPVLPGGRGPDPDGREQRFQLVSHGRRPLPLCGGLRRLSLR